MHSSEIYRWFKKRPKWVQDCAGRIIDKRELDQDDYNELLTLCKKEANNEEVQFIGIQKGSLNSVESTEDTRIVSIDKVCGVNALCSDKPLEFGNNPICVVYGRNGSGKSGYIRFLKNACGVKNPGTILPNIFKEKNQALSAKLSYIKEGEQKSVEWTGETIGELRGIEIYDTECGLIYINDENEVSYEPPELLLFTQVARVCKLLSEQIKNEIKKNISRKPDFPNELRETEAYKWYSNISENTKQSETEKIVSWSTDEEKELKEIKNRLSEDNLIAKLDDLQDKVLQIKKLVSELKIYSKNLSNNICEEFIKLKKDAEKKRKIAEKIAEKIFSKAPLPGIGSIAWRSLWEAARKYSEEEAYRLKVFPNTAKGGRCVLCQRKLDKESIVRFISFEKYIKGELQQKAKRAEDNFDRFSKTLPNIPSIEDILLKAEAAGVKDENIKKMINTYLKALEERKKTLINSSNNQDISLVPSKKVLIFLLNQARDLIKQAKLLKLDAEEQNRSELEDRAKILKAKLWLNQQKQAIFNEIERHETIKQLNKADNLTDTTALSRKKSELAEKLLTKAYIQRFQDELDKLGAGRLSVSIERTRSEVGKVYHRLCLINKYSNVKPIEILSEGEFRIVSLAAFLADTKGRKSKTTFIFDDPISSLDNIYEEATAKQLIALSQERQVIVFTHRLSFINYLKKYAKENKVKPNIVCLSDYQIGKVFDDLPIGIKKTKNVLNSLLNKEIAELKDAFKENEYIYKEKVNSICNTIRILLEIIVEKDLLYEIVTRFNGEIQTKRKIFALANITQDDCKFIDCYMTKYSKYLHSQSVEVDNILPEPDDIEDDLKKIKQFVTKINDRNKSLKN